MTTRATVRWVILRDLLIFQVKLAMDGAKDIFLMPVSIAAAAVDLLLPGRRPGRCLYAVMRLGERYDRWLCLFGAAEKADALSDGLFGASRAGSRSMLGRLEEIIIGHPEPEPETR